MVANLYLFDSSQADDPPDGHDKVNSERTSENTRINSMVDGAPFSWNVILK